MPSARRKIALLLCSALWLFGCRARRDPNVLILLVDALRPDHLGCYGYARETSPAIDALAKRGALFLDATSSASYTRAAVPSILASVHPGAHGVFSQGEQVESLADEYTTLSETLKKRGYVTAAFAPNPSLHRSFNFDQGFDLYDDDFKIGKGPPEEAYETARKIHDRALRWLRGHRGKPYFAYLHYRDVHAPYVPPPPYDRMFRNERVVRPLSPGEYRKQPRDMRIRRFRDLDSFIGQYDGEIRYTDDHIARFLDVLEKEGFLDNTIIFVTADHGESFLEHGSWTHGTGDYQELTHVPLLLILPDGRWAGQRIQAPVQTLDIYPTILSLLGAEIPGELQGENLVDAMEGKSDPRRPVFSEARVKKNLRPANWGQLIAVRSGEWKLIYNRTKRSAELYHLKEDPGETRNLVDRERERARELLRLVAAYDKDNARRAHRTAGQGDLPEDVVEGLRSLGYVN